MPRKIGCLKCIAELTRLLHKERKNRSTTQCFPLSTRNARYRPFASIEGALALT
jgi:hypothetical protein